MKTKQKNALYPKIFDINRTLFIKQGDFIVGVFDKTGNEYFEPYEFEYFHEEPKNRVVIKVRHTLNNMDKINDLTCKRHKWLPNCMIKKNDKFDVVTYLVDSMGVPMATMTYKNCVLKKVTYPMYYYGKGNDTLSTSYFEFKYGTRTIVINTQLQEEMEKQSIEKCEKILVNSNKMLDESLETAKKFYNDETNERYLKVKRCIDMAKEENNHNKKHLVSKDGKQIYRFLNTETYID